MNTQHSQQNDKTSLLLFSPGIPHVLVHDKMYKVQIGNELFTISGASLSSDSPSFFTNYFLNQESKGSGAGAGAGEDPILFLDRDPKVFEKIYNHLQGYFIEIANEVEFTKLFSDATYYNLPKLKIILNNSKNLYTNIGGKSYKLDKSVFTKNKGNSPNYFNITHDTIFGDFEHFFNTFNQKSMITTTTTETSAPREGGEPPARNPIVRPPQQSFPMVHRSSELFDKLLLILNGGYIDPQMPYQERYNLVRECKFYRFQHLEQLLLKHKIFRNPFNNKVEIVMNLLDLRLSGVKLSSFEKDITTPFQCPAVFNPETSVTATSSSSFSSSTPSSFSSSSCNSDEGNAHVDKKQKTAQSSPQRQVDNAGWSMLAYKRPFVDSVYYNLVFQLENSSTLTEYDQCSVPTFASPSYQSPGSVSTPDSEKETPTDSNALPVRETQTENAFNPYGSIVFDKTNKKIYIEFLLNNCKNTEKLIKIIEKITDKKANVQKTHTFIDTSLDQKVLLLPCCMLMSEIEINGIQVNDIKSALRDKCFVDKLKETSFTALYDENVVLRSNTCPGSPVSNSTKTKSFKGIKLLLADSSVWRLSFRNMDEIMMIAAKLRCCTCIKEFQKSIF